MGAKADDGEFSEYQVKAAFILRIMDFITFTSADSRPADLPNELCIYGKSPFGDVLQTQASQQSKQVHISYPKDLATLNACHFVFVTSEVADPLSEVISSTKNGPMLTISDIPDFTRKGGMLELSVDHELKRIMILFITGGLVKFLLFSFLARLSI
jgi:hypothetical protein